MKTLKLLGIIALSALIIIGIAGCEGLFGTEEEEEYLEGNLTIKVSDEGPFIGNELEAIYTGYENISYEWLRSDDSGSNYTSMAVGTSGTQKKFTPQNAGFYTVKIKCLDFEDEMLAKNGPIIVSQKPAYAGVLGTWKMTGSDNGQWKGGVTNGTEVVDETIVITNTTFKLDNTLKLSSASYTTGDYKAPADLGVANEFIYYTITNWESENTKPTGTEYDNCTVWKLTVTVDGFKGYKLAAAANPIYLIILSGGNMHWASKSESGYDIFSSVQNQNKARFYVKQQ